LKRRLSEPSDLDAEPEPAQAEAFQIVESADPNAAMVGSEDLGITEEYVPEPLALDSDSPAVPEKQLPAVGSSFKASVSLASIRAGLSRKRKQRQAAVQPAESEDASSSASVQFPKAFSLSALREGSKDSASLKDVASFATSTSSESREHQDLRFDKSCFSQMRVIGQFNLGFIIAALNTKQRHEGPGGLQLFIVDQHASDEKFRFEALNRDSKVDRQPLVNPQQLQLTPAQEQTAEAHLEVFRLNGFELRVDEAKPPGKRLRVLTLPTCQGLVFNEKDILDLLYKLEESESVQSQGAADRGAGLLDLNGHRALWSATALPRPHKVWTLLASRACRSAIMIGKALRRSDMEKVLRNLGTLQHPWNCPHGRPTMRHLIDASAAQKAPRPKPPLTEMLEEQVADK